MSTNPKYVQPIKEGDTRLFFEVTQQLGVMLSLFAVGYFEEKVWITKHGAAMKSFTV